MHSSVSRFAENKPQVIEKKLVKSWVVLPKLLACSWFRDPLPSKRLPDPKLIEINRKGICWLQWALNRAQIAQWTVLFLNGFWRTPLKFQWFYNGEYIVSLKMWHGQHCTHLDRKKLCLSTQLGRSTAFILKGTILALDQAVAGEKRTPPS